MRFDGTKQIMGSLQGQQSDTSATTRRKLLQKHPLKLLNLSLILYLAFGVFLFDWLGEFQDKPQPPTQDNDNSAARKAATAADLGELRSRSVGRMWNITNQLNILYESNWTKLVLEELVEFERQFIESLAAEAKGGVEIESENESESDDGDKKKKKANGDEKAKSKTSGGTKSIKKSLIHSLATITTIGSPLASLRSETGKLATVLYGALGIPLLFYTIGRTGHQLAKSSANSLLVVRHYCVSLPLHYLCCCSGCIPFQCLRLIGWLCCCCCCCCNYLCCNKPARDKRKCCDTNGAPKLKLVKFAERKRRRRQAQTQPIKDAGRHNQSQAAYIIGGGGEGNGAQLANGGLHFEQVVKRGDDSATRFMNQQQQQKLSFEAMNGGSFQLPEVAGQEQLEHDEDGGYGEESPLRSPGLFLTSLTILGLYLLLGASIYSRQQNVPIVDAIFVCYDMLSVSNLPGSFGLEPLAAPTGPVAGGRVTRLYEALKANESIPRVHEMINEDKFGSLGSEWLVWQTLYLICGLQLVSICGRFASFWLAGEDQPDDHETDRISGLLPAALPICNGYDPALASSLDAPGHPGQPGAPFGHSHPAKSEHQHYMIQQTIMPASEQQLVPSVACQPHQQQQQQQQQQQNQIDLAELFVVSQQTSPVEIQYPGLQQHQHQHQHQQSQLASDLSFASDRSTTERGSLCQLHQHAAAGSAALGPSATSGGAGAIYGGSQYSGCGRSHQLALGAHKDQHLYLAGGCEVEDDDGQEEDEYEMDRMLKTCIGGQATGPNQRSSSSSIHLSNSNAYCLSSNTIESFGRQQHKAHQSKQQQQQLESGSSARTTSSAGRQLRLVEPNGCEQDSSLNTLDTTNSNTISSVSSRTVKLPQHIHIHNGIGFVLNGTPLNGSGNDK